MAQRPDDTERFYTPAEVADMFRVDPRTVTRWAKTGRFGDGNVIRTLGGHRRYRAAAVDLMLRGGSR